MKGDDLRVESVETSPVLRTLEVEVDATRVRQAFERAYRELAKRARVKGFRPGKAPRRVLEGLYGAGLGEEVGQRLVSETFAQAISKSGVLPVAEPEIKAEGGATPDAAFRYSARVEVKPQIELPNLVGLPAQRPVVTVGDAEIEQELEALRAQRASFIELPEEARAESGHQLTIDYKGSVEGKPFKGGSASGVKIELGSERFLPGFEQQLLGAKRGEQRSVAVDFPEDYQAAKALRGKHAVFAVSVQSLARRELPELDDAFAKSLGDDEITDLDALRTMLRERLVESREQAARRALQRSVVDALIERSDFDVPPGMVNARLAQRLEMAQQQLGRLLPREELQRQLGQWHEQWRPDAERDVRESLLLTAVAEARSLAADDAELAARIEVLARDQGLAPERLRKNFEKQGMLEGLRAQLGREKALEALLDQAQIEEIEEPSTTRDAEG